MEYGEYQIPPVRCPQCAQRQNRFASAFDPTDDGFGPIDCMVCGHAFEREEYLSLLAEARLHTPPPIRG